MAWNKERIDTENVLPLRDVSGSDQRKDACHVSTRRVGNMKLYFCPPINVDILR